MFDVFHILLGIVGTVLVISVVVGYKTKLSALLMTLMLLLLAVFENPFWAYPSDSNRHDWLRYFFFQKMSVIGGLLLVVVYGPGGVSMDEKKKDW